MEPARSRIAAALLVTHTVHILQRAAFERVWGLTYEDLEERRQSTREFPMTAMTRALAEAVWIYGGSSSLKRDARALDVGTGSGIHALLMALRGHAVLATDTHDEAVTHARARFARLSPRLHDVHSLRMALGVSGYAGEATLMVRSLDDDWSRDTFSLITFNPPAYYSVGLSIGKAPAATGVFVGEGPSTTQDTFLYRFFGNVVLPALVPGGRVICTWPALERAVVEAGSRDELNASTLTPHRLLASWFGITVQGGCNVPDSFFNRRALIADDYGLGPAFRVAFDIGLRAGLYSHLVESCSLAAMPSFRYGVLCLQRDFHNPLLFHNMKL